MKTKTKVFRGLTFDILVEESSTLDAQGEHLWYLASVYVRERGQSERHLVRKSRLPGVADELAAAIRKHGIRVFDGYKPSRTDAAAAGAQPVRAKRHGRPPQPQRGGTQQPPVPSGRQ